MPDIWSSTTHSSVLLTNQRVILHLGLGILETKHQITQHPENGKNATSQNTVHVFYEPGTYNVSLNVSNTSGSSNTYSTIHVYSAPAASFDAHPTSGVAPLTVHFDDTSKGTHGSNERQYKLGLGFW